MGKTPKKETIMFDNVYATTKNRLKVLEFKLLTDIEFIKTKYFVVYA